MKYKLSDYKGKYFVIQDSIDPDDWMDIECGEIDEKELTDRFLKNHVLNSIYYDIPAYHGSNKKLKKRIDKFYDEYFKNDK